MLPLKVAAVCKRHDAFTSADCGWLWNEPDAWPSDSENSRLFTADVKNDGLLPFRIHVAVFSIHRRLRRRHFAECLPECQWGAAISRRCHAYRYCFVWVHTFLLKSTDPIVNRVYVWMFDGSRSRKTNSSVFCSSSSSWTVSRCTLVAF